MALGLSECLSHYLTEPHVILDKSKHPMTTNAGLLNHHLTIRYVSGLAMLDTPFNYEDKQHWASFGWMTDWELLLLRAWVRIQALLRGNLTGSDLDPFMQL